MVALDICPIRGQTYNIRAASEANNIKDGASMSLLPTNGINSWWNTLVGTTFFITRLLRNSL